LLHHSKIDRRMADMGQNRYESGSKEQPGAFLAGARWLVRSAAADCGLRVTAVLVAGAATERRVDPPPCVARAW
jgi:hypothetical protein